MLGLAVLGLMDKFRRSWLVLSGWLWMPCSVRGACGWTVPPLVCRYVCGGVSGSLHPFCGTGAIMIVWQAACGDAFQACEFRIMPWISG